MRSRLNLDHPLVLILGHARTHPDLRHRAFPMALILATVLNGLMEVATGQFEIGQLMLVKRRGRGSDHNVCRDLIEAGCLVKLILEHSIGRHGCPIEDASGAPTWRRLPGILNEGQCII